MLKDKNLKKLNFLGYFYPGGGGDTLIYVVDVESDAVTLIFRFLFLDL